MKSFPLFPSINGKLQTEIGEKMNHIPNQLKHYIGMDSYNKYEATEQILANINHV